MLKEQGIVIDANEHFAWIQVQRRNSCGHCTSSQACGTASLAEMFGRKIENIKVINKLAVKVGDRVIIGLEEQALVKGSLLLYLLPLFTLFIAAVGYQTLVVTYTFLPSAEIFTAFAGLCGLLVGLFLVNYITQKMAIHARYQPTILKVE